QTRSCCSGPFGRRDAVSISLLCHPNRHDCQPNDTGVQRRKREGAKRPTRPSDCNGALASSGWNGDESIEQFDPIATDAIGSAPSCKAIAGFAREGDRELVKIVAE